MVSLSPDTKVDGDWGAGYIYVEPYIRAFSHIHDWQLAGVPVMPIVGRMNGHEGYEAYKAPFSHEKEIVRAGYHKVVLDNSGITVELTSTTRVGFHRYSFPATEDALRPARRRRAHRDDEDGRRVASGASVRGSWPASRRWRPRTGARSRARCTSSSTSIATSPSSAAGRRRPAGKTVRAGVDRVSRRRLGRLRPLPLRAPGAGADEGGDLLRERGERAAQPRRGTAGLGLRRDGRARRPTNGTRWLSTIDGRRRHRRSSASSSTPTCGTRCWADGRSRTSTAGTSTTPGPEPRIRQVPLDAAGRPTRATYNSDSFWGSHWNLNVLWSFAYPRVMSEQISSLVDYYTNGGMTARGPAGGNYSFVMIGDQATPLDRGGLQQGHPRLRRRGGLCRARARTPFRAASAIGPDTSSGRTRRAAGCRTTSSAAGSASVPGTTRVPSRRRRADPRVRLPGLVPGAVREGPRQAGRLRAVPEAVLELEEPVRPVGGLDPAEEPRRHVARAVHADVHGRRLPGIRRVELGHLHATSSRTICPGWSRAIGGPAAFIEKLNRQFELRRAETLRHAARQARRGVGRLREPAVVPHGAPVHATRAPHG